MPSDAKLLTNKTIVVTGAAAERGIGRATCTLALAHGAKVIALDKHFQNETNSQHKSDDTYHQLQCDVSNQADCERIAHYARENGGIDGLVHCAGIAEPGTLDAITHEKFHLMMNINLWGTIQIIQAIAPVMVAKERGSIVCLSSLAAQRGGGFVGGLHYTAAKAGVLGVVRSLAREFGPKGIRVNAVAPGLIDTDMTTPFMPHDVRAELGKQAVLQRLGTAEEVAGVCIFLASDLSGYITGATIDVNGGLHIH